VVLDTVGTALLAAWQQTHGDVGDAALVVDLSGQHASLVVCESGHLVLARSAPTGVEALRVAFGEDLKVTLDEAEAARRAQGVVGLEAGPPALGASAEPADREATAAWLTRLAQEIRRTLEAFRSQRSGLQRCSVAVTGEGADTPGLLAALEWAIGQPVTVFDPLADGPLALPAPGHCFTIAYGLALRALGRSPISLDLAPKAERAGRRRRRERVLWVAATALLAVAVVAGYLYANARLRAVEAEAGQVRDEVRQLRRQIGDVDVALASAAAVGDVDELLDDLTRTESRPLEVLREVSVSLPGGLWLTDMLYDRERGLTLHGQALDSVSVTDAVGILSRKPYLSEVKLSAINIVSIGDRSVYEFDITAAFEAPEASTESSAEGESSRR
jgi:Tfp pilus assembly protein PilN